MTTLREWHSMAIQFRSNIFQFSGFAWHDAEKEKMKMKEKLDKCVKEKLLEFCDLLDIPVVKTTARKEDLVAKLLDFMEAPHAMTDVLLAEKEQSNKRKRKRTVITSASKKPVSTTAKRSAKKQRTSDDTPKAKEKITAPETEDEGEGEDQGNENGVANRDEDEVPEHSGSDKDGDELEDEDDKDSEKGKQGSKKSSNKGSTGKANAKKVTTPKKAPAAIPTKSPSKTPSKDSQANSISNTSPKVFSRKKKSEDIAPKYSTATKASPKEKSGKKETKGKERSKLKVESGPSAKELRKTICEILKEVDFNTATFTDILKQLARHFRTDLTPRKSAIKLMVQEELTKLAEEAEEDDEENLEAAGREVEA
ncbi:DEK domain-containing chromatin-associated protein 3-like [Tasmannia lanceolata]|uniref:DEK domain-containing chromatin-associated protein 3-like n=1 Tax=Tasmannia lanceolata TaxID=3420 RepID=UPI00406407EC